LAKFGDGRIVEQVHSFLVLVVIDEYSLYLYKAHMMVYGGKKIMAEIF
jgi:hypothetical protein